MYTFTPIYDDGEHAEAIVFADEDERGRNAELRRIRCGQQAALADLGLRALGGRPLHDLFQHASILVAETLEVEFSQVLELVDEQGLRLAAGVGWRPGAVGSEHVGRDGGSQAGFALACDQPVVVEDWRTEARFPASELLHDHSVRSGVNVVIHGRDCPWGTEPRGVLGAHTRSRRTFTSEDVAFLQVVANTLALAIERSEVDREVSKLAGERERLMADALDAEDHTRAGISQLLHDEVLQSLLTARQDLAGAECTGSARDAAVAQAREAVVEAITELRNAVTALHPITRVEGGLIKAIKAIIDVHSRRGGFDVALNVDREASGVRDRLIVSLARELLNNAAQHSGANHVTVTLRRTQNDIVFEVADDGRGMDPGRPRAALDRGHIGLASIAMRVEASGGRFQLRTNPGAGTQVRVVLPAEGSAEPGACAASRLGHDLAFSARKHRNRRAGAMISAEAQLVDQALDGQVLESTFARPTTAAIVVMYRIFYPALLEAHRRRDDSGRSVSRSPCQRAATQRVQQRCCAPDRGLRTRV